MNRKDENDPFGTQVLMLRRVYIVYPTQLTSLLTNPLSPLGHPDRHAH